MKRPLIVVASCLAILCLAAFSMAADQNAKPGKLTGSWEGTATNAQQEEFDITLQLVQNGEVITGSISSPDGSADISSGSFRNNKLEVRIETSDAAYTVTGNLRDDVLSGQWSSDTGEKGTWHAKKKAEPKN
jgi:hypothetical protein